MYGQARARAPGIYQSRVLRSESRAVVTVMTFEEDGFYTRRNNRNENSAACANTLCVFFHRFKVIVYRKRARNITRPRYSAVITYVRISF